MSLDYDLGWVKMDVTQYNPEPKLDSKNDDIYKDIITELDKEIEKRNAHISDLLETRPNGVWPANISNEQYTVHGLNIAAKIINVLRKKTEVNIKKEPNYSFWGIHDRD
jgi:hypothetical protein